MISHPNLSDLVREPKPHHPVFVFTDFIFFSFLNIKVLRHLSNFYSSLQINTSATVTLIRILQDRSNPRSIHFPTGSLWTLQIRLLRPPAEGSIKAFTMLRRITILSTTRIKV